METQQEPMGLKDIFYVFRRDPQDDGEVKHYEVGKVLVHGNLLEVLTNHHDLLGSFPSGAMSERTRRHWAALLRNPYFDVVSAEDLRNGTRPDLIPNGEEPSAPQFSDPDGMPVVEDPHDTGVAEGRPPSVFEYHHPLIGQPVTVEVLDGKSYFNGQVLTPPEAQALLRNVQAGVARIRYKKGAQQQAVAKMETWFQSLAKISPELQASLGGIRAAVKAGHISPEHMKTIQREIFGDRMVPGVGNAKAYEDFLTRPREGVHVRMDGNDFGQINKIHSFDHGNQAISSMGRAMREAMDETVGRGNGKLFRIGGDEFHAHVPTHDHAAQFMRSVREKLEAIPPIGGTHALSVSAGIAQGPGILGAQAADNASIKAKQAKKAMNYGPGQAKTHVYSAVPGHEGHIPMAAEQLPIAKPTEAFPKPAEHQAPAPTPAPAPVPAPPPVPSASASPLK
jgi:GGDEF domain-containing protein